MARNTDTTFAENQFTPLIDKAVTIPSEKIHRHVDGLRRANPGASNSKICWAVPRWRWTKKACPI